MIVDGSLIATEPSDLNFWKRNISSYRNCCETPHHVKRSISRRWSEIQTWTLPMRRCHVAWAESGERATRQRTSWEFLASRRHPAATISPPARRASLGRPFLFSHSLCSPVFIASFNLTQWRERDKEGGRSHRVRRHFSFLFHEGARRQTRRPANNEPPMGEYVLVKRHVSRYGAAPCPTKRVPLKWCQRNLLTDKGRAYCSLWRHVLFLFYFKFYHVRDRKP